MVKVEHQLDAIASVVAATDVQNIPIWLRGGWAMDFFLGEITRPHLDVDLFCWAADVDRLADALARTDFVAAPHVRDELSRDFFYRDVEVQVQLLGRDGHGYVVVPSGPHLGERWPEGMLDHPPGHIGALAAPIISPTAQIEIKTMMPVWVPGMPVREKDQHDIVRLRNALDQPTHDNAGRAESRWQSEADF